MLRQTRLKANFFLFAPDDSWLSNIRMLIVTRFLFSKAVSPPAKIAFNLLNFY